MYKNLSHRPVELNSREFPSSCKKHIRKLMLTKRNDLDSSYINESESKACHLIFSFINRIHAEKNRPLNIMSYMSFQKEFPTLKLNSHILRSEHKLALPLTDKNFNIQAYYIDNFNQLAVSSMGISEPVPEKCEPALLTHMDIILMPGIAFDKQGNRIGFGKGCYDRFLSADSSKTLLAALAYDFQIIDSIPAEPDDVPCNYIITEREIIKTADLP